jgi:glucose/arabinose dehydrogenase
MAGADPVLGLVQRHATGTISRTRAGAARATGGTPNVTEALTRGRLRIRAAATAVAIVALALGGTAPAAGAGAKPAGPGVVSGAAIAVQPGANVVAAPAAFNPTGIAISLRQVVGTFDQPVLVTSPRDGSRRLFVVEQTGRVKIIQRGAVLATPFMNLSTIISDTGERGLLGLAFHPSFKTNHKVYVNYTNRAGNTVIAEYRTTTNANRVTPGTARTILTITQPYANHNGGGIAFGPDGFLYIGMGDGGSGGDPQNRAQNLNSLLGKMLRLDVNGRTATRAYRIPSTNPYVGRTGLDEIWSRGLRNPWRWSFDRLKGDLWIGDVGQDRYEEIDRSTAASGRGRAANYGWRVLEGRHCFNPATGCVRTGKTMPIVEYSHAAGPGCSVTGGYVYRGVAFPMLTGGYFFGDYCSGKIWTISSAAASPATRVELLDTGINIPSFGQDDAGELYVVDHGGGHIYKIIGSTKP